MLNQRLHKSAGAPARSSGFAAPKPRCALRRLAAGPEGATSVSASVDTLYSNLEVQCINTTKVQPVEKLKYSGYIKDALQALKDAGALKKWGAAATDSLVRRNVFMGELKQSGIKAPDQIAVPSVRNDAAFLTAVTASTSILAVIAGNVLPGDWGFFSSYLIGGITLAVLAVGSTSPGLLQFAIDKFSQVFPDYRARVVSHEAAHFLAGYLLGVPVAGYSLMIGQEHTEFAEARLQARLFTQDLEDREIDSLAVVAVAGIAAEALAYEEVMGQSADLFDLQRILLRSKSKLSDNAQQNITRWAVWYAAQMLKANKAEFEALQAAMARGASVVECIKAIESA